MRAAVQPRRALRRQWTVGNVAGHDCYLGMETCSSLMAHIMQPNAFYAVKLKFQLCAMVTVRARMGGQAVVGGFMLAEVSTADACPLLQQLRPWTSFGPPQLRQSRSGLMLAKLLQPSTTLCKPCAQPMPVMPPLCSTCASFLA